MKIEPCTVHVNIIVRYSQSHVLLLLYKFPNFKKINVGVNFITFTINQLGFDCIMFMFMHGEEQV